MINFFNEQLKYALYEASVQDPEFDIELFYRFYKDVFEGEKPYRLREDFCGTFWLCTEWVKESARNRAVGVDIGTEPIKYGMTHHYEPLTESQKSRVEIVKQDVRVATREKFDLIAASNFSYNIFKKRAEILSYFKSVYRSLGRQGLFVMDHFGGPGSVDIGKERKKVKLGSKKYVYSWETHSYNALTSEALFYIHFKEQKGPKFEKAFEYDWRLWSIPELRDLLAEAGFKKSIIYWEDDDDGFIEAEKSDPEDDQWMVQIVGVK